MGSLVSLEPFMTLNYAVKGGSCRNFRSIFNMDYGRLWLNDVKVFFTYC